MNAPIRLFVVDDNPNFLNTITSHLKSYHPEELDIVGTANNGGEAIATIKDLAPQAALIDLKMPDMYGFELIPIIHHLLPDIAIVITTLLPPEFYSQLFEAYEDAALKAGADAFISKSFLTTDLIPTIQHIVTSKQENLELP